MADGSAELKIVVRAVDATRSVLDGIGPRIRKILLAPLNLVAKAVGSIVKQFFSLKGLLVGGGIVGVIRSLSLELAKNAKSYEPIFGSETQSKIDATASAFNKLGAQLKKTFGEILGKIDFDVLLDNFSTWVADNREDILGFFTALKDGAVGFYNALGLALGALKDLGNAVFGYDQARLAAARKSFAPKTESRRALTAQEIADQAGATIDLGNRIAEGASTRKMIPAFKDNADQLAANARALAVVTAATDKYGSGIKETTGLTEEQVKAGKAQSDMLDAIAKKQEFLASVTPRVVEETKRAIIATEEYADTIAGNFTDAFFDAIEGTKTFARAFSDMTISIVRDIGRLLVFRSIFGLVAGALTPSIAGPTPGIGGEAGGTFGAGFEAPYGFAGGGRASSSGAVRVGEQGPETVFLPRGSRVNPSHREGGMGGGITINVIGARDARATATEVMAELRRNGALRSAVRLA